MRTMHESIAGPPTGRTIVKGAVIGIVAGWVLTTVLYLAGSPIRVRTGWQTSGAKMTVVEYVLTVAISVALGLVVLAAMLKRSRNAFRRWVILAAAIAAASALPLWRLDIPTASKAWLTLMHLSTGAAAIAGQAVARHSLNPTTSTR
jgi:Family of unknown function (DUF6069)